MKRSSYASPYAIWMVMFTLVPLLFVVYFAFTGRDGSFTLRNFEKFFQPMYLSALVLSLKLAFFCTLICLLVGYPAAKFLASRDFSRRQSFVVLFLLPMWMNCLLRTYAWVSILEDTGIINTVLEWLGLPRVQMVGTEGAVLLGMVYNFLPFMILPIYTVLMKLDASYVEAAQDLGANGARTFLRVVLPLSVSGIVSGVTMVFIPSTTTFAISQLLGGGKTMLYGDLIYMRFITEQAWSAGSALAIILMVCVLLSMAVMRRAERAGGREAEGGGRIW